MRRNKQEIKAKEKLESGLLRVAIVLVIGSLAPLLDSTMANVAINTMATDLDCAIQIIQWVITGYVLAMSIAVPFSGWAINRFGGKLLYMFSMALFFVGSALCAFAWNAPSLVAFRLVQGFAAGLMMPTTSTIVMRAAGGKNIGRLMSVVGFPAMIGPILGPVLGGVIVGSVGWRWIFYINIPICVVAIIMAQRNIPNEDTSGQRSRMDIAGIFMLSAMFSLLVYGISQMRSGAVTVVAISLGAGIVLMAAFVIHALRKVSPVLDLRLFKMRNFAASNALLFMSGFVTNGAMFLLPLFYQQVRGETILMAGLSLIPQGVGMLCTRSQVGKLFDKIGARPIVTVGLIVTIIGTIPFIFADAETNTVFLWAALLVRGAGLGGLMVPIMGSAFIGLEKKQLPDASIATRIFQTIGGAFGSVTLAMIITHVLSTDATAVVQAYNWGFVWSIGFAALSFVIAMILPKKQEGDTP